jgi:hypothetical protein
MISTDINVFPSWGVLGKAAYGKLERDFLDELRQFYTRRGYDWSSVKYSRDRLREIIDMVERRRVYFHVFHLDEDGNPMEMGELNEACLYCFWILKRYPFFDASDPERDVNLILAYELFKYGVSFTAIKQRGRGGNENVNFRPHIEKHLEHAFKFRDLSKEALMALAESLIYC